MGWNCNIDEDKHKLYNSSDFLPNKQNKGFWNSDLRHDIWTPLRESQYCIFVGLYEVYFKP